MMIVIGNIKAEMARNNITGRELAKLINISATSFSHKINGRREFTATELGNIAKILNTEVNFFYNLC